MLRAKKKEIIKWFFLQSLLKISLCNIGQSPKKPIFHILSMLLFINNNILFYVQVPLFFLFLFFNLNNFLFSDKNPAIACLHVDYIQNIILDSFNTIQSQHFAQKQIALFVLTVQWYFYSCFFFFIYFLQVDR